ncbi:MAG: ABC transporter ATP-binding protein/permease [Actinobacteria bacterium]|nr:ABC transporter ATP-binding protein/permease [Actinomycetota bacterium]
MNGISQFFRGLAVQLGLAFKADPWRATFVVFGMSIGPATSPLTALFMKYLVDGFLAGDSSEVTRAAVFTGALSAAATLLIMLAFNQMVPLIEKTGRLTTERLIKVTSGIGGLEHFERPEYADKLEVIQTHRNELAGGVHVVTGAIGICLQVVLTAGLLAQVNPLLLLLPLFAIPSMLTGTMGERIRQSYLDRAAERVRQARHFFELSTTSAPAKELRVFGLPRHLVDRHRTTWDSVLRDHDRMAWKMIAVNSAGWLSFAIGYGFAILLVVRQAISEPATTSVGDVVLALSLAARVNQLVLQFTGVLLGAFRASKMANRYLWLVDYAAEQAEQTKPAEPTPVPDRLSQGIRLEDVSFKYPGTEKVVLEGVDILLPAGSTIAVVGENGAGKSTLMKLLCRFYEPTEGCITADGTDIRNFDMAEWRQRISAGFQDFAKLEMLAREVVGVGELSAMDDSEAVASALDRAGGSDVPVKLPQGLETPIGKSFENGAELSGGQWQKLALGRAMMRLSPLLLVLDEPTSALDAHTEHALFERYAGMAAATAAATGAITVLVSHRFSTVRMADVIMVVQEGGLAEVGSHSELMARGGLYAELFELQARAYR